MSRIRLKYVDHFKDRHGVVRYYFRRPGGKRTALPGLPGSAEFMAAYKAAEAVRPGEAATPMRGAPGTFDRLVADYYRSTGYLQLKAPTKRAYQLAIDRLVRLETLGPRMVADLTRSIVRQIMAKRADRPSAANDALKKLRILIKFAIDEDIRSDDPTLHIKKLKEGEHHTWSEEQLQAFEERWPVGTVQRTAFALLVFTGQRIGDVAKMSWRDVSLDGRRVKVTQEKTNTKLDLTLHDDLRAILATCKQDIGPILITAHGKPFAKKGLGNKMADAFDAAGLPKECVTHGLRKAAARRLADAGCSTHEIASVTGHKSLAEIERYTKEANQRRLSDSANSRLPIAGHPNQFPKPAEN